MRMIDALKGHWTKLVQKSNEVTVRKLNDDEVAFITEVMLHRDVPVYEVAMALSMTETRARYEMNKIKDRNERTRETTTRD